LDYLDNFLEALNIGGGICSHCSICSGETAASPESGDASFHFVRFGRCSVAAPSLAAPIQVNSGDLVVIKTGRAVNLARPVSRRSPLPDSRRDPLGKNQWRFSGQTDSEPRSLLCGYFRFPSGSSFAAMLPDFIHVRADEAGDSGATKATLELMSNEAESARAAHRTVLNRLAEILFIRVFRASAAMIGEPVVILTALRDKHIGKALAEMHSDPKTAWTVDELARIAACSRSAFCSRFNSLVGLPPLRYLTSLRLRRAKELLLTQPMSIARISDTAGYGSVEAFTRAFKRSFGASPAAFRMRHRRSKPNDDRGEA